MNDLHVWYLDLFRTNGRNGQAPDVVAFNIEYENVPTRNKKNESSLFSVRFWVEYNTDSNY